VISLTHKLDSKENMAENMHWYFLKNVNPKSLRQLVSFGTALLK
jgi:hypothetical protein